MAPRLQADTLWVTNKHWLKKVRFLVGVEPEFIASLCLGLHPMIYTPDDTVYGNDELTAIGNYNRLYVTFAPCPPSPPHQTSFFRRAATATTY